ncbi:hypothetical protein [Roseibium litorale]|uniref:Uncharacterized protein n=1 Tax=Roseibium litorale TaxID=2803841 RepID=A0ABR9CVU9_9HYPH|nr:hypothetical protein [Roseibium litorale]MBD8894340.1 hypothetical protein [Roseibium litorale]
MNKQDIETYLDNPALMPIDTERILSHPSVLVDYELFAHHLDNQEIPEEWRREYAQLVWSIIHQMMSWGFEIHPFQQVEGVCGQIGEENNIPAKSSASRGKISQSKQ